LLGLPPAPCSLVDPGFVISAGGQSARLPYLSWKIEIRRDAYRSQNGRDLGAKVKMCTPVHGLIFPRSIKYKVRVPEYTFSILPLNLVQFGFCTNLVGFA